MPGRNEPCPCGSGRKYKHCCLHTQEAADFRWRQVRAAEGRLVPELLELSFTEYGRALADAALDELFLWEGVPANYAGSDEFASFFVPWFVYEFVADPNDPDRVAGAPSRTLAEVLLDRDGARLSSIERAFLESANESPMSFYSVVGVVPGSRLTLRDILTGGEVVVHEREASRSLSPGAIMFARVVTVEGLSIISGCAPFVIPPEWQLRILDWRKQFTRGKDRVLPPDWARDRGLELRDLYFQIEDAILNPRLPQLRNTDGDRLVITELFYRLQCPPRSALDRLVTLAGGIDTVDDILSDAGRDESGTLTSFTVPWQKKRDHQLLEHTTLGTLEIDGERMRVEVNSKRRAGRIQREIAKRLGGDAVLESKNATPIEQLIEEKRTAPRDPIAEIEDERLQQLPEVQEFLRKQSARHWETWIDIPLPALEGKTPRQAARSKAGRERLEALFAEFAWKVDRAPNEMSPDVAALRAKLKM